MVDKPDNKLSGPSVEPVRVEVRAVEGGRFMATLRARRGRQKLVFEGFGETPMDAVLAAQREAGVE